MPLLESATLGLGPPLAKAIVKLWLPDHPLAVAANDGIVEILRKRGESFTTADATDRIFRNLASDVAANLQRVVEVEYSDLPESDHDAAVKAVADTFQGLELSHEMMRAGLNAVGLQQIAGARAQARFADLGGRAQSLAELILRESCGYAVTVAGKLPDFQVAATREILTRVNEVGEELKRAIDAIDSMREEGKGDSAVNSFETQYRRALSHKLDRMQLFGVRLVGAGAREPEVSVAYVTLTSKQAKESQSRDVNDALAGQTRIIIRGEAGSGKTTLLQWLAIRAASRDFAGALEPWNMRIPFYVSLRDFVDGSFPPPENLVAKMAPNLMGLMPSGWAQRTLSAGALVLVDGIDEVPVALRLALLEWLRVFVKGFEDSIFVLSSRPAALEAKLQGTTAGDRLAQLGFEKTTLEPMSLRDSEALISKWHLSVGRDLVNDEDIDRLGKYERELIRALRDRPPIRNLASNPLLCSMMCVLNWDRQQRLPDNRMELYGLALEMLVDARDAERGVRAARLSELDRLAKEALLDGLAYWMMRNGATEADRGDVETQVGMLLQRLSKIAQSPGEVLQELLERSGVLRMAARAAVQAGDFGLLAEKAKEDNWRETIVFAAGHAQGKQRDELITKLLKAPFFALRGRTVEADVTAACCF